MLKLFILSKIAILALIFNVQAAVIYNQSLFTQESDIVNLGDVHSAMNLGGGAVTLNGVNFVTNSFSNFINFNQGGGDFSQGDFVDPNLDSLFSTSTYQSGGYAYQNLNGLTIGTTYVYQVLLSNDVNNTGDSTAMRFQGQTHNFSPIGNTVQSITMQFVAGSTTEQIRYGTGSGSQPARAQITGFVLSSASTPVPEPSTYALLALGLFGFGIYRKKMRK